MVAQSVVMGFMFYETQLAACAFVCVGSHCLPAFASTSNYTVAVDSAARPSREGVAAGLSASKMGGPRGLSR